MIHRSCHLLSARLAGAVAIVLASAWLRADDAFTPPPATQGLTWDQRIDAALAATGRVDSIAADLKAVTVDTPEIVAAKARIANEQGDLARAVEILKTAVGARPTDVPLLLQLAQAQERVGSFDVARETLASVLRITTDSSLESDVRLRLAILALDEGRPDEGNALLVHLASDPSSAGRAGVVAFLYGQYAVAADCLHAANQRATANDPGLIFLEGNAALKTRRSGAAAAAFGRASDASRKPADRLYAQERLIAAARLDGTLPALANAWLADRRLPADRLLLLATTLRELGRTSDLLDWWHAASTNPAWARTVSSRRFVNEVLGAARSAGRSNDVVDICRELMARHPEEDEWLSATLSALLTAGRPAEADALLNARLQAGAQTPGEIERIGNLAASLGRDGAARRAAESLVASGGAAAITGYLLEADIHQRNGQTAQVAPALRAAAALTTDHPDRLASVVTAFESADMNGEAIDLLRRVVGVRSTEESLDRLASLLLKESRSGEAIPVLRMLMQSAASEAARDQAGQRMLEAASQAGGLDTLIADLQSRVHGADFTPQDLSLLADAYLRKNDFNAAVRVFRESRLLDSPARLNRIAVLYLRAKQYDAAAGVLRELSAVDPDNSIGTLQRLADVHLKRGRPEEASVVVGEIERQIGAGPTSCALMAGVMDQLGRPGEAAALHRRAIALNPKDTEEWLLWANAESAAGNAPLARRRLQVLCGEATTDGTFATAIDGLLNLASPPPVLRAARREAILRLAARPDEAILYNVVDDLSDELNDGDTAVRVIDASTSAGADERPQRLRNLLDLASQKRAIDAAVDAGRSLLALGDEFPPQLFLQLGEQLLVDGREAEAARAFARADESAGADLIVGRIAALYEKYGHYAAALDGLTPLADRRRADAAYQEDIARLNELTGHTANAFDSYSAALAIQCREMTAVRAGPDRQRASSGSGMQTIIMPSVRDAAFGRIVVGMILTARTPEQQQAAVTQLGSVLARLIAEAPADRGVPTEVTRLAAALRQAGFAFGRPDAADTADRMVLTRWPSDVAYEQTALAARVNDGLTVRAARFAAAYGMDPGPALRAATATTTPSTSPASVPSLEIVAQLSALVARGNIEPARALLDATPYSTAMLVAQRQRTGPPAVPVQRVIAAAAMIGDSAAAANWTMFWLDGGPQENPSTTQPATAPNGSRSGPGNEADGDRTQRYARVVQVTWPLLTDDGRTKLLLHLIELLGEIKDPRSHAAALLYVMQCAAALDLPLPNSLQLSTDALSMPVPIDVSRAVNVVLAAPPKDRPAVLRLAMERVPAEARLQLLTEVTGRTPDAFADDMRDAMTEAANQLSPGQIARWGDWPSRVCQRSVLNLLADATLRSALDRAAPASGQNAIAFTSAAMAFAAGGDAARADEAAARAIDAILLPPASSNGRPLPANGPQPSRTVLLRAAAASMSPAARAKRLAGMTPEASTFPSVAMRMRQLRAILLETSGDRDGALVALRSAFAFDPADSDTATAYLGRLKDDGRWAELIDAFGRNTGPAGDRTSTTVATDRARMELFRWPEVRFAAPPTSVTVNMAAQAAAHDDVGLATSLRLLMQNDRTSRFFTPFPTVPGPGGLTPPYDVDTQNPPALFDHAAQWPGAYDDMVVSLRLTPADDGLGGSDRPSWVATALAAAAASDAKVAQRLLHDLAPRVAEQLLTRAERQLITDLAKVPGAGVPDNWLDDLWPAALADGSYEELRRLGQALAAQRNAEGNAAQAWADMATTGGASPSERVSGVDSVKSLIALCDKNPSIAEARLGLLRSTGRIDTQAHPAAALWARTAAERNDRPAFESRLNDLLQTWAFQWTTRSANVPGKSDLAPDLALVLPKGNMNAERHRAWLDVVRRGLVALAESQPSNTGISRQLASLGSFAMNESDHETADTFYKDAERLAGAQGPGDHQLCVADLADRLGYQQAAMRLQITQLENRCLPAVRIPSVLQFMERYGDRDAVKRLSADVRTYCRMPGLRDGNGGALSP